MRYTVEHRKGFGDSLLCALMMAVGVLFVVMAMVIPGDAVPGKPEWFLVVLIELLFGGLLAAVAVQQLLSIPARTTIETDPQSREVRIDRELLVLGRRESHSYPFDDICEIAAEPDLNPLENRLPKYKLAIFRRGAGWQPLAMFDADRGAEAREVAKQLAADVGCMLCRQDSRFDTMATRTLEAYDGITEVIAETEEKRGANRPADAAEGPESYGVRIVPRDDVPEVGIPWDTAAVPGSLRDHTVFRSGDPDEARRMAERLARRIGCPWRDATTSGRIAARAKRLPDARSETATGPRNLRYSTTHSKSHLVLLSVMFCVLYLMLFGVMLPAMGGVRALLGGPRALKRAGNAKDAGEWWGVLVMFLVAAPFLLYHAMRVFFSPPWHERFEADTRERMLRIDRRTQLEAVDTTLPYSDIREIRLGAVHRANSLPRYRALVVPVTGKEQEIASFDHADEARDFAMRLAAEIGCPVHDATVSRGA